MRNGVDNESIIYAIFFCMFLGLWEQLNNPDFNYLEFEAIKNDSGSNAFVMTHKKWVTDIHAIGVVTKQGRYAATYCTF